MTRITKKDIENIIVAINCALANRGKNDRLLLVRQYREYHIYLSDTEGIQRRILYCGYTREVYYYLWGAFDILYNVYSI